MAKPHIVAIGGTLCALALAATGLAAQQSAAPAANVVTCTSPVGPRDSATALRRRFGQQARIETVGGAEGEEFRALVLYPRDPRRRLEVLFRDEAMRRPAALRFFHERARWSIAGLKIGDPLNKVNQLNGRPFNLFGFEWDYGGQVTDWRGGALGRLSGGCSLEADLNPRSQRTPPMSVVGDQTIRSDLAALRGLDVRINRLSIGWPE